MGIHEGQRKRPVNDRIGVNCQLWTYETMDGTLEGLPKADKEGRFVMKLLDPNFNLLIPVFLTDDPYHKSPLIEHDDLLFVVATFVQMKKHLNVIVTYAGSIDPIKSPICTDAYKVVKMKDKK